MADEQDLEAGFEQADEQQAPEPVAPRTVFRWAVAASLGVLLVYVGYQAFFTLSSILVQVLIALFIAVSLDPVVRWMVKRGIKRGWAVAIIWLVGLILVAGLLMVFIPPLVSQGGRLISDFPGYLERLRQQSPSLRGLEDRFHLTDRINNLARNLPGDLGHQALDFSQRFLGAVVSAVLVLVLTVYFMIDLPRIRLGLVRLAPPRRRQVVDDALNVVVDKVGGYMIGNLIVSAIAGTAAFIALEVLRIPFALPLAVLIAVTDLIPLIGATLGAAICVIVAIATTELWPNAVVLAIFFLLWQQLENYVIGPRVLHDSVQMPAVAILLAALVGASVLGLVGALMSIPVAAAVKVIATPMLDARDKEAARTTLNADAGE
jgi:predicted PurR-regulated permease PerM